MSDRIERVASVDGLRAIPPHAITRDVTLPLTSSLESIGTTTVGPNANGLALGTCQYALGGTTMSMQVDRITNSRSGGISGTLKIELWATTSQPVFGQQISYRTIGSYSLGQLQGGQYFYNISSGTITATLPPRGTYYLTLALLEFTNSGWVYQDLAVFPQTRNFAIQLQGNTSIQFIGGSVEMKADHVANNAGGTTGTLRLELWATVTAPAHDGSTITGYQLATYTLGQLNSGYEYSAIDRTVPFSRPPDGTYYLSLYVTEFQAAGNYVGEDFVTFPDLFTWGATQTPCTYAISPQTASIAASGGSGNVTVTGGPAGCSGSWSAVSNSSWIAITSGSSGSGAGTFTVTYSVQSNSSGSRSGSLTIAGQTVSISQGAGTPSPSGCTPTAVVACVLNGRFRVSARYRSAFDNASVDTDALVKPVSGFANAGYETVFFYFNSENNIELLVKLLDQGNTDSQGRRTIAVLFGTATPLRIELTITDTNTGATKKYVAAFGTMQGTTDFTAFVR